VVNANYDSFMTVNKVFNSLTLTVRRATIYISVQCALALGIASFTDKIIKIRLRVSKGEIVSCKMVCYTFVSLNCQKSNFKVRIYVNEKPAPYFKGFSNKPLSEKSVFRLCKF